MDLSKMLKQQEERSLSPAHVPTRTHSVKDYLSDPNAARPYNEDEAPKQLTDISKNASKVKGGSRTHNRINHSSVLEKNKISKKTVWEININNIEETQKRHRRDTEETQDHDKTVDKAMASPHRRDTEETQIATHFKHVKGRPKKVHASYSMLTGNALKIIDEIYSECIKNQTLETDFIEKNNFSQRVNVKPGSIRNTCVRLEQKHILEDFIATKGPGSAWKFVLSEQIYNQMCLKNKQNGDTNSDTNYTSSSSIINKTTIQLPGEWKKINYHRLQEVLFEVTGSERFGIAQLKTIYREAGNLLSADDVQTSIDHFAYGLKNKADSGVYKRRVKIASLLDSLKNGEVFREPEFFSIAKQQMKQKAIERENKIKEIEEKYFIKKFENYFNSLTQNEIENRVPNDFKNNSQLWAHSIKEDKPEVRRSFAKEWVEKHYKSSIWIEVLEGMIK